MPLETVPPPTLRFPEFSDEWGITTIDEIASFRRGSFPQPYGLRKWYDDENGFPFIQVFDVDDNLRLKDKTKRLISNAARELSVFVPKGSIVLTIQGSIGRIAITQYDACCDRTLLIFRDFKVPLAEMYFVYALHLRFEIEERIAVGGTIKTITKEKLRVFPVSLPTLPEQRKIADFLTAVDGRIGQLSQKKALLEDYKKGVMQQLFTQALRFKDDHGNDFPDWEVKRLVELCSTFKSGKGITSEQIQESGEYPVFGGNGLRGYTDTFTHDGVYLLIGRQGALCGNINRVSGKSYISEHAIAMAGNELANTEWLAQRLDHLNLNRLSESSAQPGLAVNKLERLKILTPSLPEQTKIANFLTAIDRKIESVALQITHTQTFKKGLLQQMFV